MGKDSWSLQLQALLEEKDSGENYEEKLGIL